MRENLIEDLMEHGDEGAAAAAAIKGEEILSRLCCLCGDIGFADALIRCPRCGYRLQHTYCSRFYPDQMDMENWGCEFCVHHQQQRRVHEDERPASSAKKTVRTGGGGAHEKKSSRAVDRWRKLARAAKMGSGRRYKLLADVLSS